MFGFTIWPVLRSRMRSSNSAKLTPMMMPPMHWLSAVSWSTISPQSCTQSDARHLRDAGLDVDFDLGELHAARAARRQPGFPLAVDRDRLGAEQRHASFQSRPFDGSSFDVNAAVRRRPASAGSTPSAGATRANSASSALPAVTRIAGVTDAAVVLPPEPPLNG